MLAWQYCSKCRKPITLDYYPIDGKISEALDKLELEHQVHSCLSIPKETECLNCEEIILATQFQNNQGLCDKCYIATKLKGEYSTA